MLVFSELWWQTFGLNLRSIVVTKNLIISGFVVGSVILLSFLVSLVGFSSPLTRKRWLMAHTWLIILTGMLLLAMGGTIWFETLEERHTYSQEWTSWDPVMKSQFEDQLSCCGWDNSTHLAIPSKYCTPNVISNTSTIGCAGPIINKVDSSSRSLFTTLFGFMGIDTFAFFATVILIQSITVEERYRKIDEKNFEGDQALRRQFV